MARTAQQTVDLVLIRKSPRVRGLFQAKHFSVRLSVEEEGSDILFGIRAVSIRTDTPPLQFGVHPDRDDVMAERTVPLHLALDGAESVVPDTLNLGDFHLDIDSLARPTLLPVVAVGPLLSQCQRKNEVLRPAGPHDVVG